MRTRQATTKASPDCSADAPPLAVGRVTPYSLSAGRVAEPAAGAAEPGGRDRVHAPNQFHHILALVRVAVIEPFVQSVGIHLAPVTLPEFLNNAALTLTDK